MYYSLIAAGCILLMGFLCFFCQRADITEENKLYKYRPNANSVLLRLKLFKNNKRFNYFLLVPYISSWTIFIIIFFLYFLYWVGVPYIQEIISSVILVGTLLGVWIIVSIYTAIIQQVIINMNESAKINNDKDSQKIAENKIRNVIKESNTQKSSNNDLR